MNNPIFSRYRRRSLVNYISLTLSTAAMLFALFWLGWILFTLVQYGFRGLHLSTFIHSTQPAGVTGGGLLNAITGSALITLFATLIGMPIGMLAGTYLAEFGQHSRIATITRFINDVLLSAPSILLGLFVYQFYVVQVRHFSGWAGSVALALIVIPVVIRTTENMFCLVPNTLREAAAALGTPRWKIISHIILQVSRTGIMTGILLAIARISGETAPLLFTALNNQFWSMNMNQPLSSIPVVIFQYAMSPYEDWHQLAWTGALLITLWVLSLNIIVRVVFKQKPPLH
ncbi:phosphate ABC transporter permease PstA [soil metagenome]